MEYGLTPEENLRKEIKEEIGVDSRIGELVGYSQFFREKDGNQVVCLVFTAELDNTPNLIGDSPDKDEEITEILWLTPKEVMEFRAQEFVDGIKKILAKMMEEGKFKISFQ